MKKTISILMIIVILVVALALFRNRTNTNEETEIYEVPSVEKVMENMTLEEKVGQLFIVSIDSAELDADTIDFLSETKIGNVILHEKNMVDSGQIKSLNKALTDQITKNTGIYPFICVNYEGRKSNVPGVTSFPCAMAFAATNDVSSTFMEGDYIGKQLKALGFNFNFAPVVDLITNPVNTDIGTRSYGDNVEDVAVYSRGFIGGLAKSQVLSCAKHFPGHGDTYSDSDEEFQIVNLTYSDIIPTNLMAFQYADENRVNAVMAGHVIYPKIDEEGLPASLSRVLLTDLLRNVIEFRGLIVTDSLSKKSVTDKYSIGQAAVMAVNAGANLVLTGSEFADTKDIESQKQAYYAVLEAVKNGDISMNRLNESVEFILNEKYEYGIYKKSVNTDITIDEETFKAAEKLAQQISDSSMTIVKDEDNLIPLNPDDKTLFISGIADVKLKDDITDVESEENSAAAILADNLDGDRVVIGEITTADISKIAKKAKEYDKVVVALNSTLKSRTRRLLLRELIDANPNVILVSFSLPYDLLLTGDVAAYMCAYEYTPLSVFSIERVLSGEIIASGKLPVNTQNKVIVGDTN